MSLKVNTHIILAVFGILLFNDVLLPLVETQNATISQETDNTLYKVLASLIYVLSFLLVLKKGSEIITILKNNPILVSILCLTVLSVFWSVQPAITFQRCIALIGTTLFGIFLYFHFSLKDFVRILLLSLIIISVLSLLFIVFLPFLAIHSDGPHEGLWRGVFAHKNILARTISFGVILSAIDLLENFSKAKKWIKITVLILCSVLLINSGGKSGLLIAIFSIFILYPILRLIASASRKQKIALYTTIFFSFIAFGLLASWFILNAEIVLGSVGGDLTLTGRTVLWGLVASEALNSPILGYGYGAFWESTIAEPIWLIMDWEAPHAHNGFLEIWLDIGLVGLILFFSLLYKYFRDGIKRLSDKDGKGVILLSILSYLILYSIPGNSIISQNSLSWFLFVYLMLYAGKYRKNELRKRLNVKVVNKNV